MKSLITLAFIAATSAGTAMAERINVASNANVSISVERLVVSRKWWKFSGGVLRAV